MTTFSFTIFLNFDISKMCQSVTRNVFCILFFIISYCNFCPLCFIQDSKLCLLEILSNANYSCVVWILIIVISYLSFDSVPHYIYMEKIFYLSFYLSSCMSCSLSRREESSKHKLFVCLLVCPQGQKNIENRFWGKRHF
jgi:hypothetical protein